MCRRTGWPSVWAAVHPRSRSPSQRSGEAWTLSGYMCSSSWVGFWAQTQDSSTYYQSRLIYKTGNIQKWMMDGRTDGLLPQCETGGKKSADKTQRMSSASFKLLRKCRLSHTNDPICCGREPQTVSSVTHGQPFKAVQITNPEKQLISHSRSFTELTFYSGERD